MTDPAHPYLLRRSQALAAGFSDVELARKVRNAELTRIRRGAYVPPVAIPDDDGARHALVVAATVAELRAPAVVSHASAAALHGLPLWGVRLDRVHVLRRPPASGTGSRRLHLHVARVPDEQIAAVGGIAVTTVTRTVVDLARSCSFESAVVTADAALRLRATTPELLTECLASMGPVPGTRAATRVLAFANGLSESVGESRSRVFMHYTHLPAPDLQVRVLRRDRSTIGRCDFGWEPYRTLGEFDGRVKYGRLLRPGETAGDAVFREKRREDEMRDRGWQMVRWTWIDLDAPLALRARFTRAFARGRR